MRQAFRLAAPLLAVAMALLGGVAAYADIASFNAAVQSRDFKKAAAEAAATWPTLDKSRDDLPLIAREFGFAAYMAEEFAAARMFAEAAVTSGVQHGEADALRAASEVLRDLATHKAKPSAATRDQLHRTLEARAGWPDLDVISYVAADVATAYDFGRGAWREAEASAALGRRLSRTGGELYEIHALRFDLFRNVAEYMRTRDVKVYGQLDALTDAVVAAVNAAANEEDAEPFADLYWEAQGWQTAIGNHLVGRRKMKWPDSPKTSPHKQEDRAVRMLSLRAADDACLSEISMRRKTDYPTSAFYKSLIGSVILRIDIDAKGEASNPKILAAVPEKPFGDAVLKSVKDIRYKPGSKWGAECSLAQPGRVVTFMFTIG